MKKQELTAGLIALIGIVFKILQLPFGSLLTIVGCSSLAMFYFIFGVAILNNIPFHNAFRQDSYKGITTNKVLITILLGIGIAIIIAGILFKILLWPGANTILIIGLIITGLMTIVILNLYKKENKEPENTTNKSNTFKRIAIFGVVGIVLYLTPTMTFVKIYYKKYPEYIELYQKALDNPNDLEIQKQRMQKEEELFYPKEEINQ